MNAPFTPDIPETSLIHENSGALCALTERLRQIHQEGFSTKGDDAYTDGELIKASQAYSYVAVMTTKQRVSSKPLSFWPWDPSWWKPAPGDSNQARQRDLTKACALLLAEYDRLIRQTPKETLTPDRSPLTSAEAFLAERMKQTGIKNFTPENDDQYKAGELVRASHAYSYHAGLPDKQRSDKTPPSCWPWDTIHWHPAIGNSTEARLRELEKAGALLLAEFDRLERSKPIKNTDETNE